MTPLRASVLTGLDGVGHGFFGRQGGVSRGLFSSLNCGYGSGDDAASVRENRARAASWIGTREEDLVNVYQIHSAEAVEVTAPWTRAEAPKADAMATKVPGVALGVLTADCAPVLFADVEAGVIGAAHAGWKGAIDGVLASAVALMERLGAERSRLRAAVGPCISQAAYEVGPEFYARFVAQAADNARYFVPAPRADHWQFDLRGYVTAQLRALGVGSIEACDTCTYEREEQYFSFRRTTHRAELDYGRNLSAIMLRP
jgi:YfiH family protein